MSENASAMVVWLHRSLEELWSALDALLGEMSEADWRRPHGADWTFGDLPYHLAYIDRLVVARPVALGPKLPVAEQIELRTLNQLNAWNDDQFASRPQGQQVDTSLEQMRDSRDYVRRVIRNLGDGALDKAAWFPMLHMRGFRPARVPLGFCVGHTWQHLQEARVRHGYAGTIVEPALTHAMLDGNLPVAGIPLYLNVPATSLFLDARRANEADFSFALEITGQGGGLWSFHASEAGWQVKEVESPDTDLVLTQDLDTYIKLRYFISDLVTLVEAGDIAVSDERALSFYGRLFIMPDFDFAFPKLP